ncbi:MAG: extracellular solute-binding protein [Phycisphaerales bacterium]|nr:extracellular solute-binding protein [Phycisphaerales bacterium]
MTALLIACAATGGGCDRTPAEHVVLYVSADEHLAREIVRDFERETGITVDMLGDTETRKTSGLVERLRAEQNNPQADVFWSSECFMTIELAEDGVLDEHVSEATADWPAEYRDGQRRWFGFAARARVIVYAPSAVEEDRLPFTWMDLTDARWKNRIVMADPRFGTTGGHLAAMRAYWRTIGFGDAYFGAFLYGLADNHIRLLPTGNAGVVDAVARGEADLGLTDTDDVWAAQANGYELGIIYPRHHREIDQEGGGTLLIPNTVARVKNGPNPAAAGKLIDYLLSEHVERALAASVSHNIPLRPNLTNVAPIFAVEDPLDVDLRQAADLRADTIARAMRILTGETPEELPGSARDTPHEVDEEIPAASTDG